MSAVAIFVDMIIPMNWTSSRHSPRRLPGTESQNAHRVLRHCPGDLGPSYRHHTLRPARNSMRLDHTSINTWQILNDSHDQTLTTQSDENITTRPQTFLNILDFRRQPSMHGATTPFSRMVAALMVTLPSTSLPVFCFLP